MNQGNTEDLTFKLLANPTKLKKKNKTIVLTEDDDFFLKIKKKYPEMLLFNSDKNNILKKIESILIETTITNIVESIIREIEYELLL